MASNVESELQKRLEGTAIERIRDSWVPIWLKGFERKARDYNSKATGWEPHTFLGVKGQFADIWRKVGKLKKALWDDELLEGEQPLEIIDDLISHLFLTRDLLLQRDAEKRQLQISDDANIPDGYAVAGDWPSAKEHGYDGCPVCISHKKDREDPDAFLA
jgi:hypothetical protein